MTCQSAPPAPKGAIQDPPVSVDKVVEGNDRDQNRRWGADMKGIVLALVVHTQMCSRCSTGERCSEAERLHDKWFDLAAKAGLESDGGLLNVAEAA
jgi:hypothetical protein